MENTFEALLEKISSGEKKYNRETIVAAYELANKAHDGQTRSSGEPYITHPVAVAMILLDLGLDTETIVSALLHDVVEDTGIGLDYIKKKFGATVAELVDGVTKVSVVPFNATKEERHAENIRKILISMSRNIRVIVIKLADRLHNLRTISVFKPDKQRRIAFETMNFYAPIAHRLGMARIKDEMEDICIKILDPDACAEIVENLRERETELGNFIEKIMDRIRERVNDMNPAPMIEGRVKSVYGIYKKLYIDGKDFEGIYDVYAVRVIVHSEIDCYNVLGIIHDMFVPVPGRFKDHIATPKINHYQSLHTTVLSREGVQFEVQIRTFDMHSTAEYGIAAHWRYKAGLGIRKGPGEHFVWIRRLLEQQQESGDAEQITEAVKAELTPDEVHVFTPNGDVKQLPKGSTVIDFAYSVHTHIGNKMTAAKVGGKQVSIDHVLQTGDVVEITTTNAEHYGPNRSWLNIAKTNEAKSKIRAWLKHQAREENIEQGRAFVESEITRNDIETDNEAILHLAQKHRFNTVDDFYAAIGYGGVSASKAASWIKESLGKKLEDADGVTDPHLYVSKIREKKQSRGVIVEGIEDCLVKYAKCCNPLPGDDIIGFITRGYGVSIHKKECVNVVDKINSDGEDAQRWLSVAWAGGASVLFGAMLEITAIERSALISEVTALLANHHIAVSGFNARLLKNGNAGITVTVEVASLEQLSGIIAKLNKISGVISVERTGK